MGALAQLTENGPRSPDSLLARRVCGHHGHSASPGGLSRLQNQDTLRPSGPEDHPVASLGFRPASGTEGVGNVCVGWQQTELGCWLCRKPGGAFSRRVPLSVGQCRARGGQNMNGRLVGTCHAATPSKVPGSHSGHCGDSPAFPEASLGHPC